MVIRNGVLKSVRRHDIVNGVLTIPSSVVDISKGAISRRLGEIKVKVPGSIKKIVQYAFFDAKIKKIELEEGVEEIEDKAFMGCNELESINFPKSLKKIGNKVFIGCNQLRSVDLSNVEKIGSECFNGCKELKNIVISPTLKEIPERAFAYCNASNVVIPEGVEIIGEEAFIETHFRNPSLPNSITKIGKRAFIRCDMLEELNCPKNLKIIGENAFYQSSLKKIYFNEGLEEIKDFAFTQCEELSSFELPNSLKIIGERAFSDCYGPEELVISKNTESIGESAFLRTNIQTLKFENNGQLTDISKQAFADCTCLKKVELADNIISVGDNCFKGCTSLESVEISDNSKLECIGHTAFAECSSLNKINLPDSLKIIAYSVFSGCENLTQIMLPKNLEILAQGAFDGCSKLKMINIPAKIKIIEDSTFNDCNNLKFVAFEKNSQLKIIDDSAFSSSGIVAIKLPEGIETIGESAFNDCQNLVKVDLPSTLKVIKKDCFAHCDKFERVEIPKGTEPVDFSAFEPCKSLSKIVLPASVNNFKMPAFKMKEEVTPEGYILHGVTTNLKDNQNILPEVFQLLNVNTLLRLHKYIDVVKREPAENLFLYDAILPYMSKDESEKFFENKDLKFYKQLYARVRPAECIEFYMFVNNLGGFNKNYSQKVCEFMKDRLDEIAKHAGDRNVFITKLRSYFSKMVIGQIKPEFTEFVLDRQHFGELLQLEHSKPGFIKRCYTDFEEVQKANRSNRSGQRQLKPTVNKFESYFGDATYPGIITERDKKIADIVKKYYNSEDLFVKAKKVFEQKDRMGTPDDILEEPLKEEAREPRSIKDYQDKITKLQVDTINKLNEIACDGITYEWLSKGSETNLILGMLVRCCAHLDGVGMSVMTASIVDPNVQNLVIKKNGEIIGKSTLAINKDMGLGVFNNFELNDDNLTDIQKEAVYKKYIIAINDFVKLYNKKFPNHQLHQITVGMNANDLANIIRKENKKVKKPLQTIDYTIYGETGFRYLGDSLTEQYSLWEDEQDKE